MTPRKQPEHKVLYIPQDFPGLEDLKPGEGKSWDDEISFNTQISSQWDSFCHYQHQHTGLAYNGFNPSRNSLAKDALEKNPMPTLEHWHERGGLAGRGILLDYKGYCDDINKSFDPMDGSSISIDDLEACATHFGVEFRPGDVLLVRTGYTEAVDTMTANGTTDQASGKSSGLENSVQIARWLWNKRFAAVASDAVALETMPPKKVDGSVGLLQDLGTFIEAAFGPFHDTANTCHASVLHPYMLSCFGMPIGEMWDLKELARYCRDKQRYSFMITSVPLNMPGLIGSPPNAMAIF